MADRPYFHHTIEELERLVAENRERPAVLGPIRVELEYREKPRAQQLLREVLALVEGDIPRPRPPRAARPSDQGSLFGPTPEEK